MDMSIVLNGDGTGYLNDPSMSFAWRVNNDNIYAYWDKKIFDDLPSMFTMWTVNGDIATDMGDSNGSWVGYFSKHMQSNTSPSS